MINKAVGLSNSRLSASRLSGLSGLQRNSSLNRVSSLKISTLKKNLSGKLLSGLSGTSSMSKISIDSEKIQ